MKRKRVWRIVSVALMVVFFYISVEYSRIYKRKMARGKLNIDIRDEV